MIPIGPVLRILLACALLGPVSSALVAQEVPRTFTPLEEAANETQRLVLRSVRDLDPQSPHKIVHGAKVLLDVELYPDVRLLLDRLERLNLDPAAMYSLTEAVGSDFFLEVFSLPEVQPEGKRVATKILSGSRAASQEPERMQGLIRTLSSNDISARSQAARKLRLIGDASVAELLNVFADASRSAEFPGIRGGLQMLVADYPGPVLGATRADHPQVRTEAIRLLSFIPSDAALDALMWIYLSPQQPQVLRRMAYAGLAERGIDPSPADVEDRFFQRAFDYLRGKLDPPGLVGGEAIVWSWSRQQQRMVSSRVPAETATRLIAARHAARLYEINSASTRNRAILLLTQLESNKRVAGPGRAVDAASLVSKLQTNAREINFVLTEAIRLDLIPAAIACCEILKTSADESFLVGTRNRPCALTQAILSGDRLLQFAALDAIQTIDPQQPFVGSSHVMRLAVYLAQSQGTPVALCGHQQADVVQTYAASISTAGVLGQSATSSRELFAKATADPDVEMILISDTLDMPGAGDLIEQLRNDWRTRRLPIAVLFTDVDRGHRLSQRLQDDPRFLAIPFSPDASLIARNIQRLIDKMRPFRMTRSLRARQARVAMNWLEKIAQERTRYAFYELGEHQVALRELIYRPGFAVSASRVLSRLGTPDAQRELISFASQNGMPVEQRQAAVSAFEEAVQRSGTLLTTAEIKQQYDRYNASAAEPESTQQILGSILDVIEQAAREQSLEPR